MDWRVRDDLQFARQKTFEQTIKHQVWNTTNRRRIPVMIGSNDLITDELLGIFAQSGTLTPLDSANKRHVSG